MTDPRATASAAEPRLTEIATDRGDIGERLDRVLRRHLATRPELSRTRIQQMVHQGLVLVNGQPVLRSAQRLHAGDRLDLQLPSPPQRGYRLRPVPALAVPVLYEDDHLLAVAKAAGQLVHPTRTPRALTLLQTLASARSQVAARSSLHLVSRLDRDTSGVLLIAKSGRVHAAMQRAGARGEIRKEYLGVCIGRVTPARGVIDAAIVREPGHQRRMQVTDRGGRPSLTRWRRLGTVHAGEAGHAGAALSLLRCELVTGRTHQIRVHLASRGWPVLGDVIYGLRHTPALDEGAIDDALRALRRQALHASAIRFPHPATQEPVTVTAPLPDDLARVVRACGWSERVVADSGP